MAEIKLDTIVHTSEKISNGQQFCYVYCYKMGAWSSLQRNEVII